MANNYFDFIGQNAGEEKKETPQETQAMANVTVRCDADCFLLCDGEYLDIQLGAGKMAKIQVPIGQHLLEFLYTEDPDIKIEKEVDFPESGKSYLVIIKGLKELVDGADAEAQAKEAKRVAAEEEAKRIAAEEEAKRKAEEELRILESQKEPYAVLSNNNETLTFYYDNLKSNRNGMNIEDKEWLDFQKEILAVIFDESFANCHYVSSTNSWFKNMTKLASIQGLNYLDTSNVTDMNRMFFYCESLKTLDLGSLVTNNVTDMGQMFCGCRSLEHLDLSNFNTECVTTMSSMFDCCENLNTLDLSNFNTSNVTSMHNMFHGCGELVNLNLSSFTTTNVVDMNSMFSDCESLETLDLSSFNTSNVTDMGFMFSNCECLVVLTTNFNTDNVTEMEDMFNGCFSLVHVDKELKEKAETWENYDSEENNFDDIFG